MFPSAPGPPIGSSILTREGITTTPEVKEHLWSALTSLASAPVMERTLTGLSVLLQSQALKRALQPYCVGGSSGRLLDAETERLGDASVQAFETEGLIGTGIAPAIIESCQTRLLLPNERAIEPQITAIYRRFGLNDRQIEILARATPKRDYYCQSRRGNRLFDLGLGEVALALCAVSSKTDQAEIARVLAEHGRDGFMAVWLRLRGAGWAADLIPELRNLETSS